MIEPSLRDADPGDAAALAGLFRRASLSNDGDRPALLAHPDALDWRGPPAPPARCRVATEGGDGPALGFSTTVPAGPDLELVDLFVEPGSMRRGVGRLLIDDVVAFARSAGVALVTVDANPHARAFYEASGFEVVGATSTELGPGLRMRLDVRTPAAPGTPAGSAGGGEVVVEPPEGA